MIKRDKKPKEKLKPQILREFGKNTANQLKKIKCCND